MFRRLFPLGVLAALAFAGPAAGHGDSSPRAFPSVAVVAGKNDAARRMERRARRIESAWIGTGHAAAHARQRALQARAARRPKFRTDPYGAQLQPDNGFAAPQVGGQWGASSLSLPIPAINAVMLRTGKILFFSYPWRPSNPPTTGENYEDTNQGEAYLLDPVTGATKQVTPPINPDTGEPANIFCAGTSTLPDGRVLVAGGDVGDPRAAPNRGLNTIYVFDPITESWTIGPRMNQGRWYPSQLQLPDGRTVIIAGLPETTDPDGPKFANTEIEIYSPDGSLQRLQNFRIDGEPGNPQLIGQYPHTWWMASGHALIAGPRLSDSWLFNPPAPGKDDASWTPLDPLPGGHRLWATGALLPGGPGAGATKAILFGGSDRDDRDPGGDGRNFPALASSISFEDTTGKWSAGPSMLVPRAFANAVQLPDGKLAIVGGGSGDDGASWNYRWQYTSDHKRVEIYDPATRTYTLGNAQAEGRAYHSTALLLPDARVISMGDDVNGSTGPGSGVRFDSAEIWTPPYLFDAAGDPAARPTITSAPAELDYGDPFVAGTPNTVKRAVLVAPGANTHNTDMSQRMFELPVPQAVAGGVNLIAPASANLAPPGYYMLFLLDERGVPSVARFVLLRDAPEPTPPVGPTPTSDPDPEPPAEPNLRLRLRPQATRLGSLRRRRTLRVNLTLNRAAAVKITLGLDGRRLARTRVRLDAPGKTVATLRLSRGAARRLNGLEKASLVLRGVGSPSAGPRVTVRRTLRVKRR